VLGYIGVDLFVSVVYGRLSSMRICVVSMVVFLVLLILIVVIGMLGGICMIESSVFMLLSIDIDECSGMLIMGSLVCVVMMFGSVVVSLVL